MRCPTPTTLAYLLSSRYYIVDWVVLSAIVIAMALITVKTVPHCRPFYWDDRSIAHEHHPDTFPFYSLLILILVPFFVFILVVLVLVKPLRRCLGEPLRLCGCFPSYADYKRDQQQQQRARGEGVGEGESEEMDGSGHGAGVAVEVFAPENNNRDAQGERGPIFAWCRAYIWAVVLCWTVTNLMKAYAGRLRPDFLYRMAAYGLTPASFNLTGTATAALPDPSTPAGSNYYCAMMRTHPALTDARSSFPSGHSSISFTHASLIAHFLSAHLRPHAHQGSFTRHCIATAPYIISTLCAVSRTRDNKHFFSDIVAGTLIGLWAAHTACAVAFRRTGGAAELYVARTDREVERRLFHRAMAAFLARYRRSLAAAAAHAQPAAAGAGGDSPTTRKLREGKKDDRAAAFGCVVAEENDDDDDDDEPAQQHQQQLSGSSSSSSAAAAAAGVEALVTALMAYSDSHERELNMDPFTVQWI